MEKKKIDKVIEAFRHYINLKEEGMVTGSVSGNPGFSGSSNPTGPTAGFDPVMKFDCRSKIARRLPSPYRTDLIKKEREAKKTK
jgi:hypothetical protein